MVQSIVEWIEETIGKDNMGNFLKEVLKEAKQKEKDLLEKLKDFDTWKEWKNPQQ
jgi:hypothetical protein